MRHKPNPIISPNPYPILGPWWSKANPILIRQGVNGLYKQINTTIYDISTLKCEYDQCLRFQSLNSKKLSIEQKKKKKKKKMHPSYSACNDMYTKSYWFTSLATVCSNDGRS